jgi:hypothetical protein
MNGDPVDNIRTRCGLISSVQASSADRNPAEPREIIRFGSASFEARGYIDAPNHLIHGLPTLTMCFRLGFWIGCFGDLLMRYSVPVLACLLFSATNTVSADDISTIKQAVSKKLTEPQSAHFGKVYQSKAVPQIYCGRLNSKNGFGDYTGEHLFMYDSKFDNLTILENPYTLEYELDSPEKLQRMERMEAGVKSYIAICIKGAT